MHVCSKTLIKSAWISAVVVMHSKPDFKAGQVIVNVIELNITKVECKHNIVQNAPEMISGHANFQIFPQDNIIPITQILLCESYIIVYLHCTCNCLIPACMSIWITGVHACKHKHEYYHACPLIFILLSTASSCL